MGAALVLLLVGLGAMAAGVLIGRYYVPDDRQLRRTARHSKAYMRALSHLVARDHDTVISELRNVVEENVEDAEPYFALGAIFRSRGEHERAIRVHQALAVRERDKRKLRQRAMYELGLDFRAAGMPRRATRAMEEVVLQEPGHEGALRALAALYEEQARFNEAAGLWQRLGRRRGEDTSHREHHLLVAAAQSALARDDLDSAKQLLKTAQKHQESAHFFAAAAELAAARGNHRGAKERLKQALIAEPGLAAHLLPGLIAAEQGLAPDPGDKGSTDDLDDDVAEAARLAADSRLALPPSSEPARITAGASAPPRSSSSPGRSTMIGIAAVQPAAPAVPGSQDGPSQTRAPSNSQLPAVSPASSASSAAAPSSSSSASSASTGSSVLPTSSADRPAAGSASDARATLGPAPALEDMSSSDSSTAAAARSSPPSVSSPAPELAGGASSNAAGPMKESMLVQSGSEAAERAASQAASASSELSPLPAESRSSELPMSHAASRSSELSPLPADSRSFGLAMARTESASSESSRPPTLLGVALVPAQRPSASIADRVLAVLAEIEAHSGPRLELALIRAQLIPPVDAAGRAELAHELTARFPDALAARVATARLAISSGDPEAIRSALDALVSDGGALAWALRGRWQCAYCGHRPGPFSWRCGQCRRWSTLRIETGIEPPPAPPRERRAAPRVARPEALLGASPDDALPAATLDPGLSDSEMASAGARRSLLGRVGGWVSSVWRRGSQ
jgi:lipopolysaccharide biosynthesis regulator YciM